MRVVVIGTTGHVGGYLVPRLVAAGHEVVAISRGQQAPYRQHAARSTVQTVSADREAEDAAGTFAGRIADLQPDVVIDMICFTRDSAEQLVAALAGRAGLLVHCGSIWVHGPSAEVPTTEDVPRRPFGEYGTGKAEIERVLIEASGRGHLPAVVLHPGHISGPGWAPINPAGNLDLDVAQARYGIASRAAELRVGDTASRARRRRGAGVRFGCHAATRRGRGEFSRCV